MKRKFVRIATIIGLSAVLSINTFAAVAFTDVPNTHWAYGDISYMQENGYMTKTSSGEFLPNETVSYFDIAVILAKATGYRDEKIDINMDESLKEAIRANYEKQLPKIQEYSSKYTLWDHTANEEIAYLLGTGILKDTDLSKFVIKAATGEEVERVLLKQDLAVMLVRFVGKELTAQQTYTTTGFVDEALIKEENRPHVAYAKQNGIASGNVEGEFGANDQLTRSQVATMTRRAITHKAIVNPTPPATTPESPEVEKPQVEESQPEATPEYTNIEATLNRVVAKTDTSYYVLLETEGGTKFYTATEKVEIKDIEENTLTIEHLQQLGSGTKVTAVVGEENNTDIVFQIIVQEEQVTDKEDEDKEDEIEQTTYTGEIDRIGRNNDLTIYTSKNSVTYTVIDNVEITYDKEDLTYEDLQVGDLVQIVVEGTQIVTIEVFERAEEEIEETEGTFVSYSRNSRDYILNIEIDDEVYAYDVEGNVEIIRNDDEAEWDDLRVGDDLLLTFDEDYVVAIEATSEEEEIEGHIYSILLAMNPEMTITTDDGKETIVITADTEIYDSKSREDITLRDLMIGAEVEILVESKEALSIIAKEVPDTITYKGVIEEVGSGATYIEVLVDYEPLTGQTKVLKTVNVPSGVEITIDNEESYRKKLEPGMEVLVKYSYGETMYPLSIEVID